MNKPGPNPLTYVYGPPAMPPGEIVGRRVHRFICARCGCNSDNGNCGHNCHALSVMA